MKQGKIEHLPSPGSKLELFERSKRKAYVITGIKKKLFGMKARFNFKEWKMSRDRNANFETSEETFSL